MILLGKYLRKDGEEEAPPLLRAVSLLFRSIALHAVEYDTADHGNFKGQMDRLDERLSPEISDSALLVTVGAAIQALESYNRGVERHMRAHVGELQSIISTFTKSLADLVSASDASLHRLDQIRAQLASTTDVRDLRTLRERLHDCLQQISAEIHEHRKASASGISALADASKGLARRLAGSGSAARDPATGLPTRVAFERVISGASGEGPQAVAVTFVLTRLKQMTLRYGNAVGDDMLVRCAKYVGSGLNPEGGLFRWPGPALVALLRRNDPLSKIKLDVEKLVAANRDQEMTIGSRSVMLPNSLAWALFPVSSPAEPALRSIDKFVAAQVPADEDLIA